MSTLDIRLRVTSPELMALPWAVPLAGWDPTGVALRDVPVGPSRHLVRFVEADLRLWALKALPRRVAHREYDALRHMERRDLAAVRPAGLVTRGGDDEAVLLTHYLDGSWQYRRLLMRVPVGAAHRGRLFEAMAVLMVDLHRNGIYWGDCSLANTLFRRDGQTISAWMVDAETTEIHPRLSDGQRQADLDILVENVAGGLLDVAARRGDGPEATGVILAEARGVVERYARLWGLLHDEPIVHQGDREAIDSRVRALNETGFAIDEVRLETADRPDDAASGRLRMRVDVAGRLFHADRLRSLTGLEVGEGQATILMNDLEAFRRRLEASTGTEVPERVAAQHWSVEEFTPGVERAHAAVGRHGDPTQAYCDLLEVRWLLSEAAGHDVGEETALDAMARRAVPDDSAANLGFVEMATAEIPAIHVEPVENEPDDPDGPGRARPD